MLLQINLDFRALELLSFLHEFMNDWPLSCFTLTFRLEQLCDRQVSRSIKAVNRHVMRDGYSADQILGLDDKKQ
jgi:hypothetical protein